MDLDTACQGDITAFVKELDERSKVDFALTAKICRRLFAFRRMQPWPPKVIKGTDWDSLYEISNLKKGHLVQLTRR